MAESQEHLFYRTPLDDCIFICTELNLTSHRLGNKEVSGIYEAVNSSLVSDKAFSHR